MIEAFGNARLLSFDRDPADREPTVEVAHEALIRQWPRLREWLTDGRAALRIHRQITTAAASWLANNRDDGDLSAAHASSRPKTGSTRITMI